ncbi:MAG TPA: DUF4139 domain-containing protein [Gemmataceae bacterium]|nr:DUF4139 domain-containing protein [Gemmataceae bacterium]
MRRHHLFLVLVAAATVSALFVWHSSSGAPQTPDNGQTASERRPGHSLPLSQIVLFNSGVGYFQREGVIDGDARVDLQFPASDVNDLLKSLVLQDLGHGKVTAISYDGQEPIDRTLKTFAIDLTGNPTFGQLLNQARGEKIEATLQNANGGGVSTLTGTIMGMEAQIEPGPREVQMLNLLCAEGMRCVPLHTVQRVRFLNAALDSELRHALDVLANAHNSEKKNVTVQFHGDGKRTVKVGYVVEAPMWKSSYRLVIDKAGKTALQGWGIIENTSDEDWKGVGLALVSSRPISFQMDLYPPLFVPRPVVEPERFASLRPPEYQGPMMNFQNNNTIPGGLGGLGGIGGIAGLGGGGFNNLGVGGRGQGGFQGQGNLGVGGGAVGFGGQQLGFQGGGLNRYQMGNIANQAEGLNRLTYEQLQQRRQERAQAREEAKKAGGDVASNNEFDPISGVNVSALAETIGDQARYLIDHKINLARQRSALLPLVNQDVTAQRVSIFNEKVNSKYPLRGLKIKNTTGHNLMQGPVSVYEGGSYAGDARMPDLQANEERLLSFAVDQAVEIKSEAKSEPERLTVLRILKGVLEETHRQRSTMKYLMQNRSDQERTLIVEHPINAYWKLVGAEKPSERTRDVYRFEWKVPSGKGRVREVVQERTYQTKTVLLQMNSTAIELFVRSTAASPKLRDELRKVVEYKQRLSDTEKELRRLRSQFNDVTQEQNRVRTSLDKVPAGTGLHKRYLEKLDKLETEIESLQKEIKVNQEKEKKQDAEFEKYLAELTVE